MKVLVTFLEFHEWKEFHPTDAYGVHGLQQEKETTEEKHNMSLFCLCVTATLKSFFFLNFHMHWVHENNGSCVVFLQILCIQPAPARGDILAKKYDVNGAVSRLIGLLSVSDTWMTPQD